MIRSKRTPPRKGAFWNLNRVRDSRARRARRREQQVWARRNEELNARRAQEAQDVMEMMSRSRARQDQASDARDAWENSVDSAWSTIGGMLVVAVLAGLATYFLFWVVEAFF